MSLSGVNSEKRLMLTAVKSVNILELRGWQNTDGSRTTDDVNIIIIIIIENTDWLWMTYQGWLI